MKYFIKFLIYGLFAIIAALLTQSFDADTTLIIGEIAVYILMLNLALFTSRKYDEYEVKQLMNFIKQTSNELDEIEKSFATGYYDFPQKNSTKNTDSFKSSDNKIVVFFKKLYNSLTPARLYAIFMSCLAVIFVCIIIYQYTPSDTDNVTDNQSFVTEYGKRNGSETVYISKTGVKYHKKDCHIISSPQPLPLSEAIQRGFTPCSVCKP